MLLRLRRRQKLDANAALRSVELELCKRDVRHFINWHGATYDPRNAETGMPTLLPFDLWPKQVEFTHWLDHRLATGTDGLAEKSRDSGFTWLCAAYSVHKWRFVPGFDTAFGSRKQELVDKLGDPKTIFEKIRVFMRNLPRWMLPQGYDSTRHDNFLRIINPENGNSIVGEAGDEMGRGARVTLYVIDEGAFIERAERVDAATSATARVRIWGSTVNGVGDFFHRKRFGATLLPEQIFVFDVADNPLHTPEWIAKKRGSMEEHVFASEFGRDYSASVEGICIPGKYVNASQKIAAVLLEKRGVVVEPSAVGIAGLDIGGGGKARSVAVARFGPIVTIPESWGDPDTNETAARALDYAERHKPMRTAGPSRVGLVNYDSVGVGHGALGVMSRGRKGITTAGINVGMPPSDRTWTDGETSAQKFGNLKAELWFLARERLKNTYELLLFLEGKDGGRDHAVSDILILPPNNASPDVVILAGQLSSVKWFRNEKGKIVIESKTQLRKRNIPSPDHAEGFVLTFLENNVADEWRRALGVTAKTR